MMLAKDIHSLPQRMQNRETEKYLLLLNRRRGTFVRKRVFDIVVSVVLLIVLLPLMLVIALLVGLTSRGGVFFRQQRVKQNLEPYSILKFRTMRADLKSTLQLTTKDDARITPVGRWLRRLHLDELPQLLNVLKGDMSLVGPRPEVPRYVEQYRDKWLATLLIPCGITCTSSLYFANESELMEKGEDAEACYLNEILPAKMEHNLRYLRDITLWGDIKILLQTALSVFK